LPNTVCATPSTNLPLRRSASRPTNAFFAARWHDLAAAPQGCVLVPLQPAGTSAQPGPKGAAHEAPAGEAEEDF
jgi:hypothetical protein